MFDWPHTTVNASALSASLTPPHGHLPDSLPNKEVASGGELIDREVGCSISSSGYRNWKLYWVEKWGVG